MMEAILFSASSMPAAASLYSRVNVHRGAGVKGGLPGHQHPAFEDEFVPAFRKRNALRKPLAAAHLPMPESRESGKGGLF